MEDKKNLVFGTAVGICLAVGVSLTLKNVYLGIAIGVSIGIAFLKKEDEDK